MNQFDEINSRLYVISADQDVSCLEQYFGKSLFKICHLHILFVSVEKLFLRILLSLLHNAIFKFKKFCVSK